MPHLRHLFFNANPENVILMHTAFHPFNLIENNSIDLSEDESWHLVKVARIDNNEEIKVINGAGQIAKGIVKNAHPKATKVHLLQVQNFPKPANHLNLIVAPTKVADRMEWMLEKAVELGLSELSIVITERTERKKVNTERLHKIALAAAKQSKNPWLTIINEPISFKEFLNKKMEGELYIAHCDENKERIVFKDVTKDNKLNVLIGPEGDFTSNEILQSTQKGFAPVLLTKNILRAETAALYVTALWAD